MYHVHVVAALTFCANFAVCEACSPPFQLHEISSKMFCLYKSGSTSMNYCAAQDFCRSKNGEIVHGDVVMTLLPVKPVGPWNLSFVGITDMLDEKDQVVNGWRWTNGTIIPNETIKSTNAINTEDCVRTAASDKKGLVTTNCKIERSALCQPLTPDKINVAKKVFYPRAKRPGKSRQDIPCSQEIHADIENICALECHKMSECVSFYYKTPDNVHDKNCLLIKYTDGTLDQDSEDKYTSRFSTQTSP